MDFDRFFVPGFFTNLLLPSIFLRLRFPLSGGSLLGLLGKENALDVGQNSALGDGDSGQQFVQLFVVADSELEIRI